MMIGRIAGFAMALTGVLAPAQTMVPSAEAAAEFDVVSVKPTALDNRLVTIEVGPGGRFLLTTRFLT